MQVAHKHFKSYIVYNLSPNLNFITRCHSSMYVELSLNLDFITRCHSSIYQHSTLHITLIPINVLITDRSMRLPTRPKPIIFYMKNHIPSGV